IFQLFRIISMALFLLVQTLEVSLMSPLFDNKNPAAELLFAPSTLSREACRQKGLATANVPPVCVLEPGRRHCTLKPLGTATQVGLKFPLPFLLNPIRTSLFAAILVL